jgi:hypothetical protein
MSNVDRNQEYGGVGGVCVEQGPEMQEWNGRSAQARKPCSMQGSWENEEKKEMRRMNMRKREEMKRRRRREER